MTVAIQTPTARVTSVSTTLTIVVRRLGKGNEEAIKAEAQVNSTAEKVEDEKQVGVHIFLLRHHGNHGVCQSTTTMFRAQKSENKVVISIPRNTRTWTLRFPTRNKTKAQIATRIKRRELQSSRPKLPSSRKWLLTSKQYQELQHPLQRLCGNRVYCCDRLRTRKRTSRPLSRKVK